MKKNFKLNLSGIDLSCFDEDQRKVVLNLAQSVANQVSDTQSMDTFTEFNDLCDEANQLIARDAQKVNKMTRLWKNNGRIPGLRQGVTLDELIKHSVDWRNTFLTEGKDFGFSSTDQPYLIERAISEIVKEAVEPNIVLTGLLQRINYSHGTHLTFPAIGATVAADIPEGGEYPERSIDAAGQTVATIGKSGTAFKVTEEMIRYSMFDVISMHLTAAGRALIRWKEQKVADMINTNAGGANTIFDNTSATYPTTNGRDANGAYNGTFTLDDLFYAWSVMVDRGFMPNTLIMNPFAWQIFADEAVSRAFGFINGMSMWNTLQGSPASLPQFNGPHPFLTQQQPTGPENVATTFTNVPSIFPSSFQIIISPFMPFSSSANTTDFIFCDRSELGILVVDEEVTTDEWTDPARDIRKIKLRERYGLASMNSGAGTGLIKGVKLSKAYDFSRKLEPSAVTLTDSLTGDHSGHKAVIS